MAIHSYTMPHNARRLHEELLASIPELAPTIGDSGLPEANLLLSSAGTSLTLTVPDSVTAAEIDPVLAAHDPTPDPPPVTEFAGTQPVDAVVRTTDDVPKEVFRFPTEVRHVYRATLSMTAIDATSGTTRDSEVRLVFKRTAVLQQVGSTVVLSNAGDTQAASWAIVPTVDGTDLVISVKGASGRVVDWLLQGSVAAYAPGGLEP